MGGGCTMPRFPIKCNQMTYNKYVLGIGTGQCRPTKLSQIDDQFKGEELLKTGALITSHFIPQGKYIKTILSIMDLFGAKDGTEEIKKRIDEQYNELIRCMDKKIYTERSDATEDIWRGYIVTQQDHMGLLDVGGTQDFALFKMGTIFDDMSSRIEADFGELNEDYRKVESLLPLMKLVSEAYWLTATTYLGMYRKYIEDVIADGTLNAADIQGEINNHDYLISIAVEKITRIQTWVHNARDLIQTYMNPTISFRSVECTNGGYTGYYGAFSFKWGYSGASRNVKAGNCNFHGYCQLNRDCSVSKVQNMMKADYYRFIEKINNDYVGVVDRMVQYVRQIEAYPPINPASKAPPLNINYLWVPIGDNHAVFWCSGNNDASCASSDQYDHCMWGQYNGVSEPQDWATTELPDGYTTPYSLDCDEWMLKEAGYDICNKMGCSTSAGTSVKTYEVSIISSIGAVCVTALVMLMLYIWCCFNRRKHKEDEDENEDPI